MHKTINNLLKKEYIDAIVNNYWIGLITIFIIGIIIANLIIAPIINTLKNRALNRKKEYITHLCITLNKVRVILGVILALNVFYFLPIEVGLSKDSRIILRVLNTIVLTFVFGEILVFIYEKNATKKMNNKISSLFHIIIRLIVYSAGILGVSSILKYDIKAMLTALGVGGLAVALAVQDTLNNLFAGMHILASKQLKPGDYVKLENSVEGYVLDINWRNTILKTLLQNVVIVPNSTIAKTITTNYFTLQKNLYFHVLVGVHYDSDLDFVEEVTLQVATEVLSQYPSIPKSFKPNVSFYEFSDSSINFKVWLAADLYENQYPIRHKFIKALSARYKQEKIVIPFPIRTVYMQKAELDNEAMHTQSTSVADLGSTSDCRN